MKVSKIQIGDYVDYRGQIIKVTSLYDKGGSNEVGWSDKEAVWVNADNVAPIPLTTEILEKYGFKKQSGGRFLLENLEGNYWVTFYSKDANYTCGAYSYIDINWGCITIREMPIEFLHELQHALRLCGITVNIEL